MLPASDLSEILTNLSALNLQPTAAAQILAAVLAPLLRSSDPDPPQDLPRRRAGRPRVRPRRAARRKKPKRRGAAAPSAQNEHADRDAPRQRAIAALKANPEATPTEIAKVAKCSRSTVVNARETLAAAARKEARKQARKARENPVLAKQTERRARAQQFLRGELARGPKRVSDVEEAAEKAHIDVHTLQQARGDLGVVTSRADAGNTLSVQWSLPA
jgi:hypothetical protein